MRIVRHLNRIAVGAAIIAGATLGAASAAQADGMDRGAQAAYVRPFTWTGFYVGANVGYNWGDNNRLRDLDGWVGDFRIGDVDGASFGLQVGYNQQFQRIVVGIEGDAGFFGVTGSGQFPGLTGLGAASTAESFATIDMDYYGTIAGRLGFTVADRVLMLEHATFSVISPEGCAAILWNNGAKASEAAELLKLTSQDLYHMQVIDEVVEEPIGGAHRDPRRAAELLKDAILRNLAEVRGIAPAELVKLRYDKFRKLGMYDEI
jgi:hypothetical protein